MAHTSTLETRTKKLYVWVASIVDRRVFWQPGSWNVFFNLSFVYSVLVCYCLSQINIFVFTVRVISVLACFKYHLNLNRMPMNVLVQSYALRALIRVISLSQLLSLLFCFLPKKWKKWWGLLTMTMLVQGGLQWWRCYSAKLSTLLQGYVLWAERRINVRRTLPTQQFLILTQLTKASNDDDEVVQ